MGCRAGVLVEVVAGGVVGLSEGLADPFQLVTLEARVLAAAVQVLRLAVHPRQLL